jgi:hypothetical protein
MKFRAHSAEWTKDPNFFDNFILADLGMVGLHLPSKMTWCGQPNARYSGSFAAAMCHDIIVN